MKDFPRVVYEKPERNYSKELDNLFEILLENVPKEVMDLRKQQILDHSKSHFIINVFNDLANLIGESADIQANSIAECCREQLILLHSPVYLMPIVNAEPFHKWETWSFAELYRKYWDLAMSKGWEEDYYHYNELSLENGFDNIKNYHVVDMLTDLVVNDCLICGFEIMSFMNCDDDNRLLEPFNHHYSDKIIEVKLKEKFASMKEYHDSIFNSFKKEGK